MADSADPVVIATPGRPALRAVPGGSNLDRDRFVAFGSSQLAYRLRF